MKFKYYERPFDINKPPPAPPNRSVSDSPLGPETAESKKRTLEYCYRLEEYGSRLRMQVME